MIFTYGTSLQGDMHIARNEPGQDAHRIECLSNGWVIAAVADGVGSAKFSQFGSRIAVDTIVEFCIENMPFNGTSTITREDIFALLRIGYFKAFKNIWDLSVAENNPFSSYDTTLDVVIYNGNTLIYGHCSDGGIIVLGDDGSYVAITERMKGDDGESMIPLRFTSEWKFGSYNFPVSAVLMFTDGVYDTVNQVYLEKNWTTSMYVNILRNFADTNVLFPERLDDENEFRNQIDDFMSRSFWKAVSDDKTVVVLLNAEKESGVVPDCGYYAEPDWDQMEEQLKQRLYGLSSSKKENGKSDIVVDNKKDSKKSDKQSEKKKSLNNNQINESADESKLNQTNDEELLQDTRMERRKKKSKGKHK